MPEISRFEGMIIYMKYKDNKQHHKPHIHVLCNGEEASIGIDGELLAGRLPVRQYKILNAWLVLREEQLYAAWNNAVSGLSVTKIEPLK